MARAKAKILIVDDEQNLANLLQDFLELDREHPYQIEIAYNLESALTKIDNFLPDLIITDLRLERGLEGLGIFDYLKENNLDIPIVIITAYGNKENIIKCLEKRPYYLLEKSSGFKVLREKIPQILKEVKGEKRAKPHLATVRSYLERLPRHQYLNLIYEGIENFNTQEFEELEEELPLLKLSIKDGQIQEKQLDKLDREREGQDLIPLSLIKNSGIFCERKSYKSKTTGKMKAYTYFYLRWVDDEGKSQSKFLGKFENIKDPVILEKLYQKYPDFKVKRIDKY